MTDAAKRIKQLEKGYDELRTVNNRLQALVEDVMDLGRDCAVSITGFPEDSEAIQLPANAIAAIKEELRLGRARNNEATEIEARLAEAERDAARYRALRAMTTEGKIALYREWHGGARPYEICLDGESLDRAADSANEVQK